MKLKQIWIDAADLQKYLDKYQENIVNIVPYKQQMSDANGGNKFILIVNIEKIDLADSIHKEGEDLLAT